jgi:rhodanese-related sulfurtransferase
MQVKNINAAALRSMLDDGREIAILDVREEGVYAQDGHLLLASNVPLSHLEMRVSALLPRKAVRIVTCDGGEGLAQKAAQRLADLGYMHVSVLEGGASAWRAAGFRLYTGVYVPSKAFGEYVLHQDETPEITAAELMAWKNEGRDMVIVDSRPLDEFQRNSIPGAIDCPSAELVYRAYDLVRTSDTAVVVNCGGRTRSIIGAQALVNAGFPHRVLALKDGTQGWHLSGYNLAHGCTDAAPLPSAEGAARAKEAAARVAERYGVRTIDKTGLAALKADDKRTVYLLDVRSPGEYEAGHLPGSLPAPGGQLVQATDTFVAVRHAAIVLVDDHGARATTTAAWLAQMGWDDVYVATLGGELETGAAPADAPGLQRVDRITAGELRDQLGGGKAQVVDLANSLQYSEGHIPGAWHVVRSRLKENLAVIPAAELIVFTAPDETLAHFAARDAIALTSARVRVLEGGTAAWHAAGHPLEKGTERLTGPADDLRYKALDNKSNVEAAIREYLEWEIDLVNAIDSDPDFGFRRYA